MDFCFFSFFFLNGKLVGLGGWLNGKCDCMQLLGPEFKTPETHVNAVKAGAVSEDGDRIPEQDSHIGELWVWETPPPNY